MKRMQLKELLKNLAAFAGVSAVAVDTALLLADRTEFFRVPVSYYINGPLAAWSLLGLPVSIHLAGRIIEQARAKPEARIAGALEAGPSPNLRKIPLAANGRDGFLFSSTVKSLFSEDEEQPGATYHPAVWRVEVDSTPFTIREVELKAFLDVAFKRPKHQFSRRYWTERRRPPLYRPKYDAMMILLTRAGLVEGRHEEGRASGRLVTHPRHAITYLKYESPFRAA
jgi:hypothetical protein